MSAIGTNGHITVGNMRLPVESMEIEYRPLEMGKIDNAFLAYVRDVQLHICGTFAIPPQLIGEMQEAGHAQKGIPRSILPYIQDLTMRDLQYAAYCQQYSLQGKRYPSMRKINAKRRAIVRRKLAEGRYP